MRIVLGPYTTIMFVFGIQHLAADTPGGLQQPILYNATLYYSLFYYMMLYYTGLYYLYYTIFCSNNCMILHYIVIA